MKLIVPTEFVALLMVPVYLINGRKQVKVSALLDEGGSRTYLNTDVAAELGLEGRPQELTVKVLNDKQEKLNPSVIEFTIHNLDSMDQAELLYSLEDVIGKPGEPIARLTPLGWTWLGRLELQTNTVQTNFTFLVNQDLHELNNLVHWFSDIKEPKEIQIVKPEEKLAKSTVAETLTFEDGHCSVSFPWKREDHKLPDNFEMALHHLQNTEKLLQKSPDLAKAHTDELHTYCDKGYIHKLSPEEK